MNTRTATLTIASLLAAASLAWAQPDATPAPSATPADAPKGEAEKKPNPDPNLSRDVAHYNLEKGKPAAQGYDVVAYFGTAGDGKDGKPVKGEERFAYTYRGATYWFATAKNKDLFASAPAAFEPAYGGWCAFAMADGKKVEIDPKSYLISDGRLYLFYKDFFTDTRSKWVKKEMELNPRADAAWKKISGEEPPSADEKKCPLCPDKKG